MSATSALRAKNHPAVPSDDGNAAATILVWDAPVRVFHWLMVLCFAAAYLTSESERWRLAHVTLGYTMAGLVVFRIVWGLLGTHHARFTSFVRSPKRVSQYLLSLATRQPEHHTGHNPAGALAIVGMLILTLGIATTGWMTYNDLAGEWVAELHEGVANAMLALVGLHVAAVIVSGWLHRENLVRAMLTGHKVGTATDAIRRPWIGIAVLLLLAVLGFWYLQWRQLLNL